jgi:methyl-accepting chemotaxis protein
MLQNMRMAVKLIIAFSVLVILTISVGVIGISRLKAMDASYSKVWDMNAVPLADIGQAGIQFNLIRAEVRGAMLNAGDRASYTKNMENIDTAGKSLDEALQKYEKTIVTEDGKNTFAQLQDALKKYGAIQEQILTLIRSGRVAEAKPLLAEGGKVAEDVASNISKLYEIKISMGTDTSDANSKEASRAVSTLLGLVIVCGVIAAVLGLVFVRNISGIIQGLMKEMQRLIQASLNGQLSERGNLAVINPEFRPIVGGVNDILDAVIAPVNEASNVLEQLAQNDLTARVTGNYQGDHAKIKDNLNQASAALETMISSILQMAVSVAQSAGHVSQGAESVGKASQEVAAGAQQVASGSTDQARSATMSAQNMEQLQRAIEEVARGAQQQAQGAEQAASAAHQSVDAVKRIATAAERANSETQVASSTATQGAEIVQSTIDGMGRVRMATTQSTERVNALGEASKKIGEIVEAINDIAEQTNLLALNAAIEAARAGEHGKGFAVVADEVRKLAERSAGQTKEIATLISGIQEGIDAAVNAMAAGATEVESAVGMTGKAGTALQEILAATTNVAAQVDDVARICRDVEHSALEVLKSVETVSSTTEETNAATEEMAASSSEVTKAIEQVASITEESSSVAEELSAAAEEQNASVEEMMASSRELADLAGEMQELLAQFKVSDSQQNSRQETRRLVTGLPAPKGNGKVKVTAKAS